MAAAGVDLEQAAGQIAARLAGAGFVEARSEGAAIVVQRNGLRWRLVNLTAPGPAGATHPLDLLAGHVVGALLNPPPASGPRS